MTGDEPANSVDDWYHVFLCYKWEDSESALKLREALKQRGLEVFLDRIKGEPWEPLSESVAAALARSRALVALITKNFPASPHCREELHVALSAAYQLDGGETSRVMAVVQGVSPDEVRPEQLSRYRLPYSGVPSSELAENIERTVMAHDRLFGDAPQPVTPTWYPLEQVGDRFFRGRYAELWQIHAGLRARERDSDRGSPAVAVTGLGGLGKSALCLQYARLFARDHPGGVFVLELGGSDSRAPSDDLAVETRFREHLASIAVCLGAAEPAGVPAALSRSGERYLWILDDVPTYTSPQLLARMLAPTPQGRTLISTRGGFERSVSGSIALGPLESRIGAEVLTAHRSAPPGERGAVHEIVRLLDGHPLGLTLGAGLTKLPDFAGYPALSADLSAPVPDRLENAGLAARLPAVAGRPFSRVLLRSYDSLGPAGRQVMNAASVLAPAVIPADLLAGIVRRTGGTPGHEPDLSSAAVAECAARGLLSESGTGYTMHAVVARAVRLLSRPSSYRARLRDAAFQELTEVVERTLEGYRHDEVLPHLPHVRAVVGALAGGDDWDIGTDELHLANEAGRTLIEAGRSREALVHSAAMYQACLAAGVDWYTRSIALFNLAIAHGLEGEYSIALSLKQQVLRSFEEELGAGAPASLTALNNVAESLLALRRHDDAHEAFRRVYTGRRDHKDMGPTHPHTLEALNNLAVARGHLGTSPGQRNRHLRVAHRYWLASWELWQRIARADDPYRLDALNGLALSYRTLGMAREAATLMADLHCQRVKLLGARHTDTLGSLENRLILEREAAYEEQETESDASFESVLLNRMEAQGPHHPDTATTLRNLLRTQGVGGTFAVGTAADLPDGVAPGQVRLDGDHVERQVDLIQTTLALQEQRVAEYGPDDPRTLVATSYLAYALAYADHLDGQLADAAVLAQDAYEGLADAEQDAPAHVRPSDVRLAELIRTWIEEQLDQDEG